LGSINAGRDDRNIAGKEKDPRLLSREQCSEAKIEEEVAPVRR
jgi:hypothetical protein